LDGKIFAIGEELALGLINSLVDDSYSGSF
jgi:hypothetical protein